LMLEATPVVRRVSINDSNSVTESKLHSMRSCYITCIKDCYWEKGPPSKRNLGKFNRFESNKAS
jgi:hypothetical protein